MTKDKDHGFDWCLRCRQWQNAISRRRGGQPERCWTCHGPMKRLTSNAWMALFAGVITDQGATP